MAVIGGSVGCTDWQVGSQVRKGLQSAIIKGTWMFRWKLGSKVRICGLHPQYMPFINR